MRSLYNAFYSVGHICFEWLFVIFRCPRFFPVMLRLAEWGIFRSPYLAAKHDPQGISQKALTYGEITLSTIDSILRSIDAGPDDLFLDLGSGRGRVVLYAATLGIPARGVEIIPSLIEAATYAGQRTPLATFERADLRDVDLSKATIIWIVGTCWEEDTFAQLSKKIETLDHQPTIISVSAPIPHIPILELRESATSWGIDRFYIQSPRPPKP